MVKVAVGVLLTALGLLGQTRVNVGGPLYVDSNGNTWAADTGCTSTATYNRGSQTIQGTNDPTLYRTGRTATSTIGCTYTGFSPALYTVTLLFAETDPTVTATGNGPGAKPRIMNVYINGVLYFAQLNVLATSRQFATAYSVTTPFIAVTASEINIQVTQIAFQPMLSGIDIEPGPGGASNNWLLLTNKPFVDVRQYSWTPQTPGGSIAIGSNTITVTPVPVGVAGTNTQYRVYVAGGVGTAEACLVTGGTAVSGGGAGTLVMTCANTHTGAWTISSASAGIGEAIAAQSYAGSIFFPCGTYNLYGTIFVPRLMSIDGDGQCANLVWLGPTNTAAMVSGDLSSNNALEYLPVRQNFRLSNGGAVGTTIGILVGGDPNNVIASSNTLGGRATFSHVLIQGFNTQAEYGTHAYNITWDDVRFDSYSAGLPNVGNYGIQFGVSGVGYGGDSGTLESFTNVKFIGSLTAAIHLNAPTAVSFTGARCENNRRCFYLNDGSGSDITWAGGHFETYTDNPAAANCATLTYCGPFVEAEALVNTTMTIIGSSFFYNDASVGATNYFNFNSMFRIGLHVLGSAFGSAPALTVTNLFNISATDSADSVIDIALSHYSQGVEPTYINVVNTPNLQLWRVQDANGKQCVNCANPGTTAAILFANLPPCGATTAGITQWISDGSVNTWGTNLAGGGANSVLAGCNGAGANWTVVGK